MNYIVYTLYYVIITCYIIVIFGSITWWSLKFLILVLNRLCLYTTVYTLLPLPQLFLSALLSVLSPNATIVVKCEGSPTPSEFRCRLRSPKTTPDFICSHWMGVIILSSALSLCHRHFSLAAKNNWINRWRGERFSVSQRQSGTPCMPFGARGQNVTCHWKWLTLLRAHSAVVIRSFLVFQFVFSKTRATQSWIFCDTSVALYENRQITYDNGRLLSVAVHMDRWGTRGKTSCDKIKFDTNCICSRGGDTGTFFFSEEWADSDFICLSR